MNGKLLATGILAIALATGIGVYYAQEYAYYDDASNTAEVRLTSLTTGQPERILFSDMRAIDALSSPIRFRACFSTTMSIAMLSETYEILDHAEPRIAPQQFDCFDAEQIGNDLANGAAVAFMGQRNYTYGIDRVVAIYTDGRGFVWHQINDCGEKLYDGSPADPNCPERQN